jgi:hypothetical protein
MDFQKQNHTVVSITLLASGIIEFRDRQGVFHAEKSTTVFTKSGKSYIGVDAGSKGFQFDLWSYTTLQTPTTTITYTVMDKLATTDYDYEARRVECLSDLFEEVNKACCDTNVTANNNIGGGEFVYGEVPSGVINGINATFTSAFNFDNTQMNVFINGVLQKIVQDYNTTGLTTINFVTSPIVGDTIIINYIKQ